MTTTRAVRLALRELVADWLEAADGTLYPSLAASPVPDAQVKSYLTTPLESAESPNWCILHTIHTTTESAVLGDSLEPCRIGILLAARINRGDAAETSREAAEAWLDDAEEMLVNELSGSLNGELWTAITITPPRRDTEQLLYGKFRTSSIVCEIDKR